MKPSWPANEDFKKAIGVTQGLGYLKGSGYNIHQINTLKAGPLMVNTGRADYWLESIWADDPEINQIVKFNDEGYSMEFFRKNPLHLVFADTQRGRNFLTIWNQAFAELIRDEVAYRKAYRLNIPDIFSTPELSAYLVFMRKEVPELFQ